MTQEQNQAYIDAIEYAETPEEEKQAIANYLRARPELRRLMSMLIDADEETLRTARELMKPHQDNKTA